MANTIFHSSVEGAQHGAKALPDFLAYAKANPGKVNIGMVAAGPGEIETNAMIEALGIQPSLITYKGLAPIYPALMSGELHAALAGTPPQLKTGEIVGIAAGRTARNPSPSLRSGFISSSTPPVSRIS